MGKRPPCHDCPDETPTCRGECPRPAAWDDKHRHHLPTYGQSISPLPLPEHMREIQKPKNGRPFSQIPKPVFNIRLENPERRPVYDALCDAAKKHDTSLQEILIDCARIVLGVEA